MSPAGRESALRAEHLLEAFHIDDLDLFLLDAQQARLGEPREQAADGFQFQPKEAADFFAAHAQHELRGRITSYRKTLRQVQQKSRQAFLCAHRAYGQQHSLIANDFPAHQPHELPLQGRQLACQIDQIIDRNSADLGVFQRNRVGGVRGFAYAVQSDDLARQVESGNLLPAIGKCERGFDCAETDTVDRIEAFADTEQSLSFFKAATMLNQFVHFADIAGGDAYGQAYLAEATGRAADGLSSKRNAFEHEWPLSTRGPLLYGESTALARRLRQAKSP